MRARPDVLRREAYHADRDPGTPMPDAAAEVVADWARAAAAKKWAARKWQLERAEPQILAQYGQTRESLAERTRLLALARAGDEAARRTLAVTYNCRVLQAPERAAYDGRPDGPTG